MLENPSKASNVYLVCKVMPIHMHIVEFCQFVEERLNLSLTLTSTDLCSLKVLRGSQPGLYTILVKMRSVDTCNKFLNEFQNRKFNQLEPDKCTLCAVVSATHSLESTASEDQSNCPICLESIIQGSSNSQNE